jgi:hypothetical protein
MYCLSLEKEETVEVKVSSEIGREFIRPAEYFIHILKSSPDLSGKGVKK